MPRRNVPRPSPRAKAVKKIDGLIKKYQENEKHFDTMHSMSKITDPFEATELKALSITSKEKAEKGLALRKKILKGMRTKKGQYTMKELMIRAKPWTIRLTENRTFLHHIPAHQKAAIEKLASGKTVTRNEMGSIEEAVREYRGVLLGETKYLRR